MIKTLQLLSDEHLRYKKSLINKRYQIQIKDPHLTCLRIKYIDLLNKK